MAACLAPANGRAALAGRVAYDYQFTAMGSELELGTFSHENGHMLCDYPDLYDYGYESSGVGGYCLMCGATTSARKTPSRSAPISNGCRAGPEP